jgi:Zn finger protein HypA/HybF involved in hydrogenase expression
MLELLCLRCYKCNHEYEREVRTEESICEFVCPKCGKKGIELDIGKKVRQSTLLVEDRNMEVKTKRRNRWEQS